MGPTPLKNKTVLTIREKDNRNLGAEAEPTFAQSFKGASHTLNHITPFPPFRTCTYVIFSPINTSRISKSPQERFLLV